MLWRVAGACIGCFGDGSQPSAAPPPAKPAEPGALKPTAAAAAAAAAAAPSSLVGVGALGGARGAQHRQDVAQPKVVVGLPGEESKGMGGREETGRQARQEESTKNARTSAGAGQPLPAPRASRVRGAGLRARKESMCCKIGDCSPPHAAQARPAPPAWTAAARTGRRAQRTSWTACHSPAGGRGHHVVEAGHRGGVLGRRGGRRLGGRQERRRLSTLHALPAQAAAHRKRGPPASDSPATAGGGACCPRLPWLAPADRQPPRSRPAAAAHLVAAGRQLDLDDDLAVGHHHGDAPEQSLCVWGVGGGEEGSSS